MAEEEREVLSKPPFSILINPESLRRRKPWEIDLSFLLTKLLEILTSLENLDLRFAGNAALTSSLIYRLKVESLFLFEKVRERRIAADDLEVPLTLRMPFRFDLPMSSLEELFTALRKILQEIIEEGEEGERPLLVEPEPTIEVDNFEAYIRAELEKFQEKLLRDLSLLGKIKFGEYTKGLELIERVRAFILLLMVATGRLVKIEQDEEDEIAISPAQA